MKVALAVAQLFCLFSLLSLHPRYRLTCLYLLFCIPATLSFHAESVWLHAWYPWLAAPIVLLRLAAGIEVLHRQTEGFRFWWRLTGTAFVIGGFYAACGWVRSGHVDFLGSVVELRRLIQIFIAGVFLYAEGFWITEGGGWYRRADHLAVLFGLLCLNHGVISFVSGIGKWGDSWGSASWWSWGIDGAVYLLMALRVRYAPSAAVYPATWK